MLLETCKLPRYQILMKTNVDLQESDFYPKGDKPLLLEAVFPLFADTHLSNKLPTLQFKMGSRRAFILEVLISQTLDAEDFI